MLPVQAQGPGSPACCVRASAGWRGTAAGGRAWRRGCLILVTGYGCGPASAAAARGMSARAACPAVAAGRRTASRRIAAQPAPARQAGAGFRIYQ